jgi:hypothetical protein
VRLLGRGGSIERLQQAVTEAAREAKEQTAPPEPARPKPEPVVVAKDETWSVWAVPAVIGAWLAPAATLALVAVLVPFMLLERGFITDKLIRLMGRRRLAITTKALDEAAERVSRFLLMQTIVNLSYGLLVALGLLAIGLPYAALWGFLAAVLRFVPYVGPWIAALLPVVLGLAIFEGWTRPMLVAGLFVVLELFTNMVLETVLYAGSAGVSQVGLLVAVAFWTALWGPIGLLLATPLTVCLIAFGRYVPELSFLVVLMSDERVVPPDVGLYQRLLADNMDDAIAYLEEYGRSHPEVDVRDAIFLPVLAHARRDRAAGTIGAPDEAAVTEAVARMAGQLEDVTPLDAEEPGLVLGCPARDRADEVALHMLAQELAADGITMAVLPATLLTAEVAREILVRRPAVVVVGSVPPGGLAETRHLCKRLRATPSEARVVVARWGEEGDATADVRSLAQARAALGYLARVPRRPAAA